MIKRLIILFAFFFSISFVQSKENTDSIFTIAIGLGKQNLYLQAITEAQKALASDKSRGDILVYIANVYSWNNQNDSAFTYVEKARLNGYLNDEFFSSWLNILFRSHQFENLLSACEVAAAGGYGNKEDLLKKKMLAFSGLKRWDEGILLARNNEPLIKSMGMEELYAEMIRNRNTNLLTAAYTIDFFDAKDPEQLLSAGFGFRINKVTMELRANGANRFGLQDLQLECDGYFPVFKRSYLYLNYGFGFGSNLFPQHRIGIEYFFPLWSKTEGSLGGRYLHFAQSDAIILTGHLEHYISKYWISYRPFLVKMNNGNAMSLLTDFRRYEKNGQNYWGLEFGIGNSPDDHNSLTQNGTYNVLNAYRIKLNRNFLIRNVSIVRLGFGYNLEEFQKDDYRNRYELGLIYRFRL
ncbi:MAG TPA: YaiO family outer membrane beta-barrel protein [Bacteroidales bacterium]|nr:YaiO family outer membrane beta-barrel protein [Bacteroidales bacterium]